LVIECCKTLLEAERAEDMIKFMNELPPQIHEHGRMQIMEARAYMMMNELEKVKEILEGRPLVSDIREGEVTLSNLWFEMHEKIIAKEENIPIDDKLRERVRRDYPPPSWLDFRQAD